jgi:hypothetical protein
MRSRSALDHTGIALGAAVESIWCGALAAALTHAPWSLLVLFALLTMVAAAEIARWMSRHEGRQGAVRLLVMTLVVVAAAILFAAGRSWLHPFVVWQVVRDALFASGLVFLGIHVGRASPLPEDAVRRSVRAFALLCTVLVVAAIGGETPGWAAVAIAAAVLGGALLIAVVRYRTLADQVDAADRLTHWRWLPAVTAVVLIVIAAGALLSQLLDLDVLQTTLGAVAAVLRYMLAGVAYLIGWAGALLVRGIGWVLGLLNLHAVQNEPLEPPVAAPQYSPAPRTHVPGSLRLVATIAGVAAAAGLAITLVVVALRRFQRGAAAEEQVVEERETLTSLRSAARRYTSRMGRRLRRRLQALRRREPGTPAELVRWRYAQLESRLARAGRQRPAGVTVRDHLAAAATPSAGGATARPAGATAGPAVSPAGGAMDQADAAAALSQAAADLAVIYEVARYSAHAVDAAQANRFERLAAAFPATGPPAGSFGA